ncbi:MAG: hypothetical protein OEW04_05720 [Nitrospirota bacterium]|nr:hypothetical protein [Nitrospirota bacterium]
MFERLVVEPLQKLLEMLIQFLPNLFSAVFILLLGIVISWISKYILTRFFKILKLDELSDRSGISKMLSRGGIKGSFSTLLAKFISFVIIFAFVIISLNSLNIFAIENLFEKFFLYLPNVFIAVIIVIFGSMLSNFLGRAALIASVNAGFKTSGLIGKAVKLTIFLFSVSIALEQLGIGKETVVIAFAIIIGGIVLSLSIAFGLGGRDIAREYLEKKVKGAEEEKDEISHL